MIAAFLEMTTVVGVFVTTKLLTGWMEAKYLPMHGEMHLLRREYITHLGYGRLAVSTESVTPGMLFDVPCWFCIFKGLIRYRKRQEL